MIQELMVTASIKSLVDNITKELVVPKIKQFCERLSLEYDKKLIPTAEHFTEYMLRAYEKYSTVNTLVLRNRIKQLKNIYVPLTLESQENVENTERIKLCGYPKEFFQKNKKLLIMDTAGMGKSTIVKRLFLDVIDQGYGIPIFIELRRINETHDLISEIESQISSLTQNFNHQLLLELIMSGGFIFFFDGCDEIPMVDRAFAMHCVEDFISKASANTYIITSRPDEVLNCFGNFKRMSIKGLTKKESFQLLRKYDGNGIVSNSLIEKLQDKKYEMITEFLENPLLVSLLFTAFEYKPTIPINKQAFYRQVFDALFEAHDLSKGDSYCHEKRSKLHSDDFAKILRRIGYECQKRQQVEFLKTDILNIIDKAKGTYINMNFASSDLLKDLLTSVPLFCKDGNYYKWAHKSLQEYFAALFISIDSKNSQEKILTSIYESDNIQRYINLLDLYIDIDPTGFQKYILIPLLDNFVSYYNSLRYIKPNLPKLSVDVRLGYLFGHSFVIGIQGNGDHLFEEDFGECFKNKYGIKVKSVTFFHPKYYIADCYHKEAYILKLLKDKEPELFSHHKGTVKGTFFVKDSFLVDDIKSNSNSVDDFDKLNNFIGNAAQFLYLDIDKVIPFLDKLRSTLSKGYDLEDLCDGL